MERIDWDRVRHSRDYYVARRAGPAAEEAFWQANVEIAIATGDSEDFYESIYSQLRFYAEQNNSERLLEAAQALLSVPSPSAQLSYYVAESALEYGGDSSLIVAHIEKGYQAARLDWRSAPPELAAARSSLDYIRLVRLELRVWSETNPGHIRVKQLLDVLNAFSAANTHVDIHVSLALRSLARKRRLGNEFRYVIEHELDNLVRLQANQRRKFRDHEALLDRLLKRITKTTKSAPTNEPTQ